MGWIGRASNQSILEWLKVLRTPKVDGFPIMFHVCGLLGTQKLWARAIVVQEISTWRYDFARMSVCMNMQSRVMKLQKTSQKWHRIFITCLPSNQNNKFHRSWHPIIPTYVHFGQRNNQCAKNIIYGQQQLEDMWFQTNCDSCFNVVNSLNECSLFWDDLSEECDK